MNSLALPRGYRRFRLQSDADKPHLTVSNQHPTATNRDDEQNFSRYYVKRLPAEVLLDAVSEVTGVTETFAGFPPGTRAIELWDNRLPSYFLEIFGRPARTSPCECGRSSDPTMSQALHLMNAPEVGQKISDSAGRVARLVQRGASRAEITEELCLAALARPPHVKERHVADELFADSSPRQAAEDLLWTLLTPCDSCSFIVGTPSVAFRDMR
jgi:hypothetical protein